MKLYELLNEWKTIETYIEDEEISEDTLLDTLECIDCEINLKAENCAKIITNIDSDVKAIKSEIERLNARKKHLENRIHFLKSNLEYVMRETKKTKIKTDLFSFNIQKNPPAVRILDEEKALNSEFVKIEKTINKTAVREALQSGQTIEFAELIQTEGLRIR